VIETPDGTRILTIDGFAATTDARLGAHYMRWMGSLPMLLHPKPRRALVICFGTGQTAQAVRVEGPEELDVVELSPEVLRLAPLFEANEGVLEDGRVRTVVMDGRAWLRRTRRLYEVVTLEPMPPNFAGVNALYSNEFYRILSARLAPGGVVAQWLPVHLLEPDHAVAVAATFRAVFPDAVLWVDPVSGTGILLGRLPGSPRPLGAEWPGLDGAPRDRTLTNAEVRAALMLDPEALARYAAPGRIITDDNQLLAFGRVRARLDTERSRRLQKTTDAILARVAGRPPFRLDLERLRELRQGQRHGR
jgi:spermidine synthase